jgi:Tfp pilus assembly protein PilO
MKGARSNGKLLVLLGVLVVGAVYLLVWRPRAAELSDARSERDDMAQELATLQATPTTTTVPAATPTAAHPAADSLAAAVPDQPALAELLRQFQTIAVGTGVTQESVSPSPVQAIAAGAPGSSLGVEISVSGPKPALYDYLHRLAALDRLFVVDKMTIEPKTSDAAPATTNGSAPTDSFHLDVSGRAFTAAAPAGSPHG